MTSSAPGADVVVVEGGCGVAGGPPVSPVFPPVSSVYILIRTRLSTKLFKLYNYFFETVMLNL